MGTGTQYAVDFFNGIVGQLLSSNVYTEANRSGLFIMNNTVLFMLHDIMQQQCANIV